MKAGIFNIAALDAGLGQTLQADFVIVLQSWSDQFGAQHEINELIGRMLFKRILCCYDRGARLTVAAMNSGQWHFASQLHRPPH